VVVGEQHELAALLPEVNDIIKQDRILENTE
jgi:hypothetical protein